MRKKSLSDILELLHWTPGAGASLDVTMRRISILNTQDINKNIGLVFLVFLSVVFCGS